MRSMHGPWSAVDEFCVVLALCGYWLEPTTRILDFGCGAGRVVSEFRDKNFTAFGFDICDNSHLIRKEHADLFSFGIRENSNPEYIISDGFRLPYADNSFDIVVSSAVLEHVMNCRVIAKELARILSPRGITYHVFPSRTSIAEPHIFIPFGGMISGEWWVRLWAAAGIRNQFQEGQDAKATAHANMKYYRTGLKYRSDAELLRIFRETFGEAQMVSHILNRNVDWREVKKRLTDALKSPHPWRSLAGAYPMRALLAANPVKH